ncbi:proline-rich receptor-like protein kinase PERK2 [Iris pallida]|uniref:Proline-rich receptor-like protein kinase PERK2 n=1 Tax=Iris pallida TaxID=29817 RepID=A0AAX6GPS2_IRIPA|nr:proline-rich receptor-like protein kinase PERK2 [Iris pallida]
MWRRPRMVVDGIGDSYSRYGTARSGGCGRRRRSDRGSGRENVDLDLEHQWGCGGGWPPARAERSQGREVESGESVSDVLSVSTCRHGHMILFGVRCVGHGI